MHLNKRHSRQPDKILGPFANKCRTEVMMVSTVVTERFNAMFTESICLLIFDAN